MHEKERHTEREREWSFSQKSSWTRKKKRIDPRLICQEARTTGQIFISGRSWTCVIVQGRRTSREKRKKEEVLLCTLLFSSTYKCASSHFNVHLKRWQGHNILHLLFCMEMKAWKGIGNLMSELESLRHIHLSWSVCIYSSPWCRLFDER